MPVWIYVLALGAFGLITTELGIIGILPLRCTVNNGHSCFKPPVAVC
jgi:hypothetical protein